MNVARLHGCLRCPVHLGVGLRLQGFLAYAPYRFNDTLLSIVGQLQLARLILHHLQQRRNPLSHVRVRLQAPDQLLRTQLCIGDLSCLSLVDTLG